METEGKVVRLGAKHSRYCGVLSISRLRKQWERELVLKFTILGSESTLFHSSALRYKYYSNFTVLGGLGVLIQSCVWRAKVFRWSLVNGPVRALRNQASLIP